MFRSVAAYRIDSFLWCIRGEDAEILILGTLPRDMSLAAEQYYANPCNDVWKLGGAALNLSLVDLPYQDRVRCLIANHIGLWVAFHSCIRPGCMDGNTTEPLRNDFSVLKNVAPNINLICFNGKGAAEAEEPLQLIDYFRFAGDTPNRETDPVHASGLPGIVRVHRN